MDTSSDCNFETGNIPHFEQINLSADDGEDVQVLNLSQELDMKALMHHELGDILKAKVLEDEERVLQSSCPDLPEETMEIDINDNQRLIPSVVNCEDSFDDISCSSNMVWSSYLPNLDVIKAKEQTASVDNGLNEAHDEEASVCQEDSLLYSSMENEVLDSRLVNLGCLETPNSEGEIYSVDVVCNIDTSSMTSHVVSDLMEIRNSLNSFQGDYDVEEDDNLGIADLFKEDGIGKSKKGVRSKSSRKRKIQQKRLFKQTRRSVHISWRPKFASSFQEIKQSTLFLDEDFDQNFTCPVCLELYFMPTVCTPCHHIFCDPCLRRLTDARSENVPCPLCRTEIMRCDLDKDFDELLLSKHSQIYLLRAQEESKSKARHQPLPFTAPVPLRKRLLRQLIFHRNSQSNTEWMSHDCFKFLLGCTVGICLSLLIMLLNRVKSIHDVRDVNIIFLSCIFGGCAAYMVYKVCRL